MPSTSSRSPKSEKLQAFYSRKQATDHLQVMSNRVSQLEKIKSKAQQDIEKLKSEIEKEQQRINDKNNQIAQKRRFTQLNNDNLEMRKILNKKSREDRKRKIKEFNESLLKEKQNWVQMKKQLTQKWLEEVSLNKDEEMQKKTGNCKRLKTGYVKSLRERCANQRHHEGVIRARYTREIQEERRIESQAYERIDNLEEQENELIEDLSKTIEIRKSLKENLNRLRNFSL
jgi:chromosome segregation ATPase